MEPLEIMRNQVVTQAANLADKKGYDKKAFIKGAEYAIRYFKDYFMLELAYQNKLLKAREYRNVKRKEK